MIKNVKWCILQAAIDVRVNLLGSWSTENNQKQDASSNIS